ncbi:c-type cytochrome [Thioalkalivibrio thiocyanodenitrificans]|uniref:c-type cytochrome n=1 Tax=Thioalkalivibrio thiocyanodenitrificans TaxID=243063 RepID=UPI00037CC330|nr:c-type cytochrome [Thioalkalivibrio thiocyanodenitrificans]
MTRFVVVLSVLVLLAAVFFLAARLVSVAQRTALPDDLAAAAQARVEERIRPIGRVATADDVEEDAPENGEPARRSASDIYRAVCAACHDTGAAEAPLKGDEGIWADRLGQGLDTVVQHAIEGIGAMPARGGASLSDEEVRAAVVYLLEESGQTVDNGAPEAVAEADAEAEPDVPAEPEAEAVAGDPTAGQAKFATCIACHGAQGQGMGIFPKLAGHTAEEIVDLLTRYRAGETVGPNTPLMAPQAVTLSDEDIANLAAYIETL